MNLNTQQLEAVYTQKPRYMTFVIPTGGGKTMNLLLERKSLFAEGFQVRTPEGRFDYDVPGVFYSGRLAGHRSNSLVTVSIFNNEVMALVSTDDGDYVLGVTGGRHNIGSRYIFYKDSDLLDPKPFTCGTDVNIHKAPSAGISSSGARSSLSNLVNIYVEADYELYLENGSGTFATLAYVTNLFNSVQTLYDNEAVDIAVSEIFVWSSADPYSEGGSGLALTDFSNAMCAGFNGDLAHLVSGESAGGGVAYLDALCGSDCYATGYSGDLSTGYPAYPNYSWEVGVVTHELGHNLSSPHTHDCVWGTSGTDQIDDCGPNAGYGPDCGGPTPPANQGTIMSYCHLNVGIGFAYGFGPLPGDKIRNYVANAPCLLPAITLDCSGAIIAECGSTYTGNNGTGGTDLVDFYNCVNWDESGPEIIYVLNTNLTHTITATLSGMSADLDVFILNSCSEEDCATYGNTSATLSNAAPGTYYIVVDGYFGVTSDYTLDISCTGYCEADGFAGEEWIDSVSIAGVSNLSGSNNGFGDFTSLVIPMQRGDSIPVALKPAYSGTNWFEYWDIYIDLNQDEDFDDAGEHVYTSGANSNTTVTGNFVLPGDANLGNTRMRVFMHYNSSENGPCGTLTYGEVEDYTVQILPFCPSFGYTGFEFIQDIAVGSLSNVSGNNFGYADYTSVSPPTLIPGQLANVTLNPGFTGSSYTENWRIWLDLNGDGDFDVSEQVFQGSGSSTVSGSFQVPINVSGNVGMRIGMRYGDYPEPCLANGFDGEVEDYMVFIETCGPPYNWATAQQSTTSQLVSWDGMPSSEKYRIQYRPASGGSYTSFVTTATYKVITGLAPNTTYEVRGRGYCNGAFTGYGVTYFFTTSDGVVSGCPAPTQGTVEYRTATSKWVYWNYVPGAVNGYRIRYRPVGGSFTVLTSANPYRAVVGLLPGTTYEYRLQSRCSGGDSAYGPTYYFTTDPAFAPGGNSDALLLETTDYGVSLAPNPATNELWINLNGLEAKSVLINDLTGRNLLQLQPEALGSAVDVSGLQQGVYFVQITTHERELITMKFVKM